MEKKININFDVYFRKKKYSSENVFLIPLFKKNSKQKKTSFRHSKKYNKNLIFFYFYL